MGSIMEYETCPNCGSEESYIRDYYYKSDEEYCFCSKCGHVHNYFMTNQKIRVVVPFKTLKKKIYDEVSRKCIVKKKCNA